MPPIYAAALVVFCEGMVLWAVYPIMNYYTADLGGGPEAVGILFALLSAPRVIFNPIFGRLSERFGRRPLMIVASLGTMGGSILWAVSTNVTWLGASRLVAGIFGAQAALSAAVVADVTEPERRGAGLGVIGAAFGLSMVLGPVLGGLVSHWAGYAAVGWVSAGFQAASVLTVVFLMRETRPATAARQAAAVERAVPRRAVLGHPGIVALLAVTLALTMAQQQISTTFSMLAEKEYNFAAREVGYVFALLGFVGMVVQGGAVRALLPRYGDRRIALAGLVCLVLGAALVAAHPPSWALWCAMGVVGAGAGLSTPTVTALLSGRVGPEQQGTLLGVHQGVTALGRGLSAYAAGEIFAHWGARGPYWVSAVIAVVALAILRSLGERPRAAREIPAGSGL